jgi:Tol biopolymer transport system component
MSRIADALERESRTVDLEPGDFERLLGRRERKDRNRRVRAGAVGVIVAIAMGIVLLESLRSHVVPANPPAPRPPGIFAPVGGWVTYGDKDGIWAVNPARRGDPGDRIKLSSERGDPLAWSPDGSKLLVRRNVRGLYNGDLYVLNADGSWNRLTQANGSPTGGSFSSDGTEVVYGLWRASGHHAIYVDDVEGGPPRLVTNDVAIPYAPAFSPDGSRIAYFDGSGDWGNSLHVMNADGSDVRELTGPDYGHIDALVWSPDGSRLAFSLQNGGGLFVVGVDGSGLTQLIRNGENPAWSPDGSRISFQRRAGTTVQEVRNGEQVEVTYCPCGLGPLEIVTVESGAIQAFGYAGSGPWNPLAP